MKLIGYYRTSTDDKGQDPGRQKMVVDQWAKPAGHEIVAHVIDEGTSGATDPFQRQYFLEALALAEKHGAQGIAVEAVDRASRGGVEAYMVLKAQLRLDYDLVVKVANTPPGLPPAMEELWDAVMAMVARMQRDRIREQVKSGWARMRAKGFPNGRPGKKPKPELTLAEKDLVRDLVLNRNAGVDKVALALSDARGAFKLADPGAMMERRVGPTWLWKQIQRSQMQDVCERLSTRRIATRPTAGLKENGGA